jgi:Tol biopolymer transport system component/DNA-binding winged helix-turn-helix (wHTH) protein
MSREARPSYEFGPFRLDLAEQMLLRDGHQLLLTPKVFDVLRVLVQNGGHLVEKETLLKEVWPDSFVEEAALNKAVSVLRKALGETSSGQKYIETAPKRGYRFVAPVTERLNDSSPPIVESESGSVVDMALTPADSRSLANPPPSQAARAGMAKPVAAIAGVFLIVGALAYVVVRPDAPEKASRPPLAPTHRQVTFTGKEGSPTLSPDGRRIAYVSDDAPEKKLVVQELGGGQPLTVFTAPEVGHLRWSPDGSDLLMWTRGSVPDGVYIMPQLGGTPRRIAAGQYVGCWSPDGATIVVGSYLGGKVWFLNRRGEELRTVLLKGVQGPISDIDWSPANGLLLFVSDDNKGRYSIWMMRSDGTDQRRVLLESTGITSARWTPQGDAIYFLRRLNQTVSLHKIPARPAHQDREADITALITGLESDRSFAVSADGKRLVYARAPYHSNLWMLDMGGPGNNHRPDTKELTRGTSRIERARISPDGTSIVFNVGHEPRTELYTLPITGGSPKQLTFLDAFSVGGVWSADGKWIAFASTQGGTRRVWTVNAGGGIPRAVSSSDFSENLDLAWSPGSQILYQQAGNRNYYELDPETRKERLFVRDRSAAWIFSPAYSPDRRKIAVFWNRPPNRGIWVIDAKDRRETLVYNVSASSSTYTPIGWSADGRSIYVVEGKNSTGRDLALPLGETITEGKILMVPADGGESTTVAPLPFKEIGSVSMTPDGTKFVFSVYSSGSDVWVVDNFDVPSGSRMTRK